MDKFDTTCRTCNAIRSNLVNLYSNSPVNDSIKLYDVLCSVCPSLSIQNNDKLPQKICFFCSKQLEIAYKFQLQCKKSDEELWKVVKDEIKEDPSQAEQNDGQSLDNEHNETNDEMSCPEDVFEDTVTVTGSPEFLEEDDEEMEIISGAEPVTAGENSASDDNLVETSFDCNTCAKKFLTSNGLLMHKKLAHRTPKPTGTETFKCKYCNLEFESKDEQKIHYRSEHKNDLKGELTCCICQKKFLGKNKLDHHMLYHEKNQFQCLVKDCKRTFNIKYKVTDHLKRFHGILLSASQSSALKPISIKEI